MIESWVNIYCYFLVYLHYLKKVQPALEFLALNLISYLVDQNLFQLGDIDKVYFYLSVNSPLLVSTVVELANAGGGLSALQSARRIWAILEGHEKPAPKSERGLNRPSLSALAKIKAPRNFGPEISNESASKVFNILLLAHYVIYLIIRKVVISGLENGVGTGGAPSQKNAAMLDEIKLYDWRLKIF